MWLVLLESRNGWMKMQIGMGQAAEAPRIRLGYWTHPGDSGLLHGSGHCEILCAMAATLAGTWGWTPSTSSDPRHASRAGQLVNAGPLHPHLHCFLLHLGFTCAFKVLVQLVKGFCSLLCPVLSMSPAIHAHAKSFLVGFILGSPASEASCFTPSPTPPIPHTLISRRSCASKMCAGASRGQN